MKKEGFKNFALILFIYTLLVILWGAWVRISHSGDGCGDTWPLCHGQLIPEAQRGKTWVEYGHRLMSGFYGLVVLYFWWNARKIFPKTSLARKAAFWTLIFMITEALLGAKLVLFKLVTTNDTPLRAAVMALHQVNSLLLSGAVTIAFTAAGDTSGKTFSFGLFQKRAWLFPLLFGAIAVTGAWAALSSTLFPSQDLWQGLMADLSSQSHYLIHLRGLHPIFAILIGGSFCYYFWSKSQSARTPLLQKTGAQAALVLLVGLGFGLSTLLALSPVWMKITHLALAQIIWFCLLRFVYALRAERQAAG
jgi:cytochrome c oxidase assembly protein subunit 15